MGQNNIGEVVTLAGITLITFKRAKEEIYTISAVSIIGADIPGGGYWMGSTALVL